MSKLNIYPMSWKWKPGVECDIQFAEYLKNNNCYGKSIFHFGTGEHHKLAKANIDNHILGITASKQEYNTYIDLVTKNPELAMNYKVIFGDIYTLSAQMLPMFNFVTLFHLCEYSKPKNDYGQKTDEQLLEMFLAKVNPCGRIVLFKKSNHFKDVEKIIDKLNKKHTIEYVEEYKDIIFYRKFLYSNNKIIY